MLRVFSHTPNNLLLIRFQSTLQLDPFCLEWQNPVANSRRSEFFSRYKSTLGVHLHCITRHEDWLLVSEKKLAVVHRSGSFAFIFKSTAKDACFVFDAAKLPWWLPPSGIQIPFRRVSVSLLQFTACKREMLHKQPAWQSCWRTGDKGFFVF